MQPRVTVAGELEEEKQGIRGVIVSKNQTYISCKYFHSEICPHKDHEVMQHAVIIEGGDFTKIIFKGGKESSEINNKLCNN